MPTSLADDAGTEAPPYLQWLHDTFRAILRRTELPLFFDRGPSSDLAGSLLSADMLGGKLNGPGISVACS